MPMHFISRLDAEAHFSPLGLGPKGPLSGRRTAKRLKSDDLYYASRLTTARDVALILARSQGDFTECVVWAHDLVWGDRSREDDPPKDWADYGCWRRQHGATRSLHEAPGHVFGAREQPELARLLELAIYMGWDALIGARASKVFIELSHADRVTIHARSQQTDLISALKRLGLRDS